jgi:Zn-finger nucleic acid-binding protein
MKCPTDNATLVMSERNGVEIDYCPECRGVWLDRGELDKIIDRADAAAPAQQGQPYQQPAPSAPYRDAGYDRSGSGYAQNQGQQPYYRKKKKENWLSELFD